MLAAAAGLTACSAGGASNDYIRIAKYKGVEVEAVEGLPDITDESVENNIQTVLEGFAQITEVTDRPAREGDIAVITVGDPRTSVILPDGLYSTNVVYVSQVRAEGSVVRETY